MSKKSDIETFLSSVFANGGCIQFRQEGRTIDFTGKKTSPKPSEKVIKYVWKGEKHDLVTEDEMPVADAIKNVLKLAFKT